MGRPVDGFDRVTGGDSFDYHKGKWPATGRRRTESLVSCAINLMLDLFYKFHLSGAARIDELDSICEPEID